MEVFSFILTDGRAARRHGLLSFKDFYSRPGLRLFQRCSLCALIARDLEKMGSMWPNRRTRVKTSFRVGESPKTSRSGAAIHREELAVGKETKSRLARS